MQVKGNLATQEITNASFIWDHKCIEVDTGIKFKADINKNFSASVKNPIIGFGNYIFGVQTNDFGGANRFNYGVQLELNLWSLIDKRVSVNSNIYHIFICLYLFLAHSLLIYWRNMHE